MSLRRPLLCAMAIALPAFGADLSVQIGIDPGSGKLPISPYIYGTNQDLPGVATPGVRRFGGNRLSGYNWETNASNAGTDYLNNSDNFLVDGLPNGQQAVPAIAFTSFHDASLAASVPYTILTLQMAGYVAADENGPVTAAQGAPSSRWNAVQNNTPGGAFPATPNLTDGTVYMDEVLNLLVSKYGHATGKTGVRGYNLDNEPALWPSTHPRIHPQPTTCAEEVSKSEALSATIKRMDPTAEVLGPVLYGSEAYFTFQNAPDWTALQASTGFRWFIDYYLDQMSKASATAGTRLLDALDLHRYSDENVSGTGPDQSITNQTDFSDTASNRDRVQAPRVLWDKTFVENSWVQQYFSQFLPWIPNIQASISAHFPGTKLSFTEYNYGGESDISGGIAQADVLGIYGKFGVYLGCVWILHGSPAPLYTSAAFNLYLNFDGKNGKFGATGISETDSDTVNTSAYASVDAAGTLHVVVLNKSFTQAADLNFQIAGSTSYGSAAVYAFDAASPSITARAPATLSNNQLTYALPPLTAAHFVIQRSGGTAAAGPQITSGPVSQAVASGSTVTFSVTSVATGFQWMLNGQPVQNGSGVIGATSPTLVVRGVTGASAGTYTCVATNGTGATTSSPATLDVITTTNPGRLINLSARAQVGTGGNIIVAGFVVGPAGTSGTLPVLVRGSGPAIAAAPFNVPGTLPDPQLQLFSGQTLTNTNDGWLGAANIVATAAAVGAFNWNSSTSHDSAFDLSLAPGACTAQVAGQTGDTGDALVEVYDATPSGTYAPSKPRLINLAARVNVGTGGNALFAGFVISGSTSLTVLIRASGPAIAAAPFNVPGTLPDPQLTLQNQASTVLASDVSWGGNPVIASVANIVGAFGWNDPASHDSALLVTLPPGAYTAAVVGTSGDTGVGIVEVYEVP
ncbi:MAG TPA: glycoside hydrolase family 44 protein [Opitutaceae bacterium]